ncbi:plasminogen activator inhibitor 1 RNA-binding protein-like [Anopheles nili]|uniref:plasminogen activator inhibitor 1 RNA-binding protein-like n=1 Tax=Anopheles nili TaxID=185578 RepID=UPI00237B59C5|nr:plasminogen activator inhibitor 1 RNA-binding protein-like [Anopheles nili]
MENTSYGINVANRYDLFCIDDDAGDPIEAILKSKQKQQKKQQQSASAGSGAAAPAAGAQGQQTKANVKGSGTGEKENKAAGGGGGGGRGAENRHPDKSGADAKHAQTNGTGNHLHNQRGGGGGGTERRGIKETQKDNIRNQENQRTGGANPGAKFPRGNGPNAKNGTMAPGAGGGNDDKYPRKNRDFDDGQRKPYVPNGAGPGGVKRFDGRGKRELDRQSGSNKTGIKAVDKRDGAGSHNWGSSKQDAKEYSNMPEQDYQPQDADTSAEANAERTTVANGEEGADGAANAKSDDEAKEMTLDEWKAQKAAVRLKPQYNLRKAGEGEDSSQWDKMVALDKKPSTKADKIVEADDDDANDTHNKPVSSGGGGGGGSSKNKQILEIEYHFNDSRRGGLGRPRGGRGGRGGGGGGRGMGRDGPGGRREYGADNYREGGGGGGGYNNHYEGGADGGDRAPHRDSNRRNNRPPVGGGPDRTYDGGMNKYSRPNPRSATKQRVPAAPKVDDEHDFPSLG